MLTVSPIDFPGLGLTLDPPVSFSVGPLTIALYGICIATGLLLAVLYGCMRSKQFGIRQDDILDGVLLIVPFAVICARLYYCAFQWDLYKDDPISILYIWKGGLAIYGGVIGAVIGVSVFCKFKKIKLPALLDLVALGFLIGQSLGRWGNFFNREAFGAETESFLRMGLMLTPDRAPTTQMHYYHPTFLYESLWNIVGFVILHAVSKKRKYDGQVALGYCVWYGLGRTIIEGLRTDSLYIPGSETLRVSQLLAAVTCFVGGVLMVILSFKRHKPEKLYVNQVAAREAAQAEEAQTEEVAAEVTLVQPLDSGAEQKNQENTEESL